jgi:hypothetical protein
MQEQSYGIFIFEAKEEKQKGPHAWFVGFLICRVQSCVRKGRAFCGWLGASKVFSCTFWYTDAQHIWGFHAPKLQTHYHYKPSSMDTIPNNE